jgi:hypothetical protein
MDMSLKFKQGFLGFPAIPNPADQLEKPGIPSFSWEFPMISHKGVKHLLNILVMKERQCQNTPNPNKSHWLLTGTH